MNKRNSVQVDILTVMNFIKFVQTEMKNNHQRNLPFVYNINASYGFMVLLSLMLFIHTPHYHIYVCVCKFFKLGDGLNIFIDSQTINTLMDLNDGRSWKNQIIAIISTMKQG